MHLISSILSNNATCMRSKQVVKVLFSVQVFDRQLKKRHKKIAFDLPESCYYDYLREESARRLVDRIEDIKRSFPNTLEVGCNREHIYQIISSNNDCGPVGGIEQLIQCDLHHTSYIFDNKYIHCSNEDSSKRPNKFKVQCDEEFLPFQHNSFDLVLSSLALHWVNDLPSSLKQIYDTLKPDGVFIGSMLGGSTLQELKHCFYLAELERKGGISPHVSPYALASDVAGLIQSVGFTLPTIDVDTITISYPDAFSLMEHLFKMGEGSSGINRQYNVGKDTFLSVASIYQELYGLNDGSVPATFELIYMIGWKPHASQPMACQRGSAAKSLKDLGKR